VRRVCERNAHDTSAASVLLTTPAFRDEGGVSFPLGAFRIDMNPLAIAGADAKVSIRPWPIATQSETPSSLPIRSLKPASESSLTRPFLKFDPRKVKQAVVALFPLPSYCLIEGFRLARVTSRNEILAS
jgi:hypothetical protein